MLYTKEGTPINFNKIPANLTNIREKLEPLPYKGNVMFRLEARAKVKQ